VVNHDMNESLISYAVHMPCSVSDGICPNNPVLLFLNRCHLAWEPCASQGTRPFDVIDTYQVAAACRESLHRPLFPNCHAKSVFSSRLCQKIKRPLLAFFSRFKAPHRPRSAGIWPYLNNTKRLPGPEKKLLPLSHENCPLSIILLKQGQKCIKLYFENCLA
jgi:hypothetical protein